jgi:hypothetical protein
MPRRKTTRTHTRRQRINHDRKRNIPDATQHLKDSIAPF